MQRGQSRKTEQTRHNKKKIQSQDRKNRSKKRSKTRAKTKQKKKHRATCREQGRKRATYTQTRIVPTIVLSLQQEKQKKTQQLTSTVNQRLHCWFFYHLKSIEGERRSWAQEKKGKQKERGERHHCSARFFSVSRSRYAIPIHFRSSFKLDLCCKNTVQR